MSLFYVLWANFVGNKNLIWNAREWQSEKVWEPVIYINGDLLSVIVSVIGNKIADQKSNPERSSLHFPWR